MIYDLLMCFFGLVLDVFASARIAPDEKDIQIALLRQQLRILERRSRTKPRLTRPEKLMLVILLTRLQRQTHSWYDRLHQTLLLFKPDTLLKWHQDLVRRKWTFKHVNRGGRPLCWLHPLSVLNQRAIPGASSIPSPKSASP
jgi:hypothetical protein